MWVVLNEAVIKTVAAFMNSSGGTLAIGLSDEGEVLGIQADLEMKNHDLDTYENWLTTLLASALGGAAAMNASIRFEAVQELTVCLVDVSPTSAPVFADTFKGNHRFYVRNNNSTRVLEGQELITYVRSRFGVPQG